MYFEYGQKETDYLKSKDRKLAAVIDAIGRINRPVEDDVFAYVVKHIVGQQISAKAQSTVWQRALDRYGTVSPESLAQAQVHELQSLGLTFKKAGYIRAFVERVLDGQFDLNCLAQMPDKVAISMLTSLDGVGVWTAEMILLFALQRPDVFSYGDLAIRRGLRMLYRHTSVDRTRFERYRRRFSPYGSVASLYIWAVAGGAMPELKDLAKSKREGVWPTY